MGGAWGGTCLRMASRDIILTTNEESTDWAQSRSTGPAFGSIFGDEV